MLKSKKGFTLLEICIVLGVVAIIGSMLVTTFIFVARQNDDIKRDANFINDVTDVQKKVYDWIRVHDSAGYEITHQSGMKAFVAEKGSEVSTISFSNDSIIIDGTAQKEKYTNISAINFQIVEDIIDGKADSKLAQVTVTAKKGTTGGTETQKLLFPIFSDKTRERSVTGKNG